MSIATQEKPTTKAIAKADWTTPTNANGLQRMGESILPQIKAALPQFLARNADRFLRCLLTECGRTPNLLDCTPRSLLGAVIQCAQLGLEVGGPAGQAYLIPFKREASLIIGYKGYITLAHRSGNVKRITPRVVRAGDTFDMAYGSEQHITHRPNFLNPGKPVGYYAVVELKTGGTDFEYLTVEQAEAHRDRFALSKSGPWKTNFDEMATKTAIRRLAKRLPLSVEWVQAAGLDDLGEEGLPQRLETAVVIEGEVSGGDAADDLRERLAAARGDGTLPGTTDGNLPD